jgi:hypothetical protein
VRSGKNWQTTAMAGSSKEKEKMLPEREKRKPAPVGQAV